MRKNYDYESFDYNYEVEEISWYDTKVMNDNEYKYTPVHYRKTSVESDGHVEDWGNMLLEQ